MFIDISMYICIYVSHAVLDTTSAPHSNGPLQQPLRRNNICEYIYLYIHIYIFIHTSIYICVPHFVLATTSAQMARSTNRCEYAIYAYIYTYIYSYIYTYIYIYLYLYPTPCSPLQVPPIRIARSANRCENAFASWISSGFVTSIARQ